MQNAINCADMLLYCDTQLPCRKNGKLSSQIQASISSVNYAQGCL